MPTTATQQEFRFPTSRRSIEQRFAEFDAANPHFYQQLESRALKLYHGGARRISVKALCETLRAEGDLRATPDHFGYDNSLTALFSRKLLERHPLLAAVIETRVRKSA
jgi:hypothetical protein